MEVPIKKLSHEQLNELAEGLKKKNDINYTALKLAEELMELSELLIKSVTKIDGLKPTKEELVEELGDVGFRYAAYIEHQGWEEEVMERVDSKAAFVYERMKEGKIGSNVTVTKTSTNEPAIIS